MAICERVFIGLGANIGRRKQKITSAIRFLSLLKDTKVYKKSALYEASPVGPAQRNFLNAVVELRTGLEPDDLLQKLKAIEFALGRHSSKIKWGPREIDLDIIFYGRRKLKHKGLEIPHKEAHRRLFVLLPLNDIAPGFIHPLSRKSIRETLSEAGPVLLAGQKIKLYGRI